MKRITPTLLGTLLLGGSAGIALAAGPVSAPSSPAPATLNSPSLSAPSSQNRPAGDAQLSQNAQPQEQSSPAQNKPNSTEDDWSQDLAAGSGQPNQAATTAGSAPMAGSGQDTMSSKTPAPSGTSKPSASRSHRQPAHRVAKNDAAGDRMTEALNILSSDGYADVQTLTPQGDQFVANVTQNGRNVSVVVDPRTRQVTNRS
jgi:hypothetical protein